MYTMALNTPVSYVHHGIKYPSELLNVHKPTMYQTVMNIIVILLHPTHPHPLQSYC